MKYHKSIIILLLIMFSMNELGSQKLRKHVVSTGGATIEAGKTRARITVGQPAIGRMKITNLKHNIGFWYSARKIIEEGGPGAVVVIPKLSAEIGDIVDVPIILKESKLFDRAGIDSFEAVVRYNTTVLQPFGATPLAEYQGNDESTVMIRGTVPDSAGVMAYMTFLVRLGSVEKTPLVIDTIRWIDCDRVKLVTVDGELQVLGICEEGDTVRLVHKSVEAGIVSNIPNPTEESVTIEYQISEEGISRLSLFDNLGSEFMVLKEGYFKPGKYKITPDITDAPNGQYLIILVTPSELYSRSMIIRK